MIENKKVVATIEARMTSTRLPGKILMSVVDKPVLQHIIERISRSTYVDEVVVATTINATDDPVVALCEKIGCAYFRGSEDDVLARVVGAGTAHSADILVQGYGDDPCVDHRFIDHVLGLLVSGTYDCAVSNDTEETFPIGLGVCAYDFPALKERAKEDTDSAYREHAGYSIRSQPEQFSVATWRAEGELYWPTLRLTLDTEQDFELIRAVYGALCPKNQDFSAEDVIIFLRTRPDFVALNSAVKQKVPQVSS
jgi:spore coat polysaccharide biosynthesis protein SpsF